MPAKKSQKGNTQKEQLQLLRQILAELQVLNASLGAGMAATRQAATEPVTASDDQDDHEELEEYE